MTLKRLSCTGSVGVSMILLTAMTSYAQEAINTNNALAPGAGNTIIRQQFRYFQADLNTPSMNKDIDQFMFSTTIVHGLSSELTAIFNVPVLFRSIDNNLTSTTSRDEGVGDINAVLKWQLFRHNTGPTDTSRFSLLGGVEIRSGDSNFSSDSYDPLFGGVYTISRGRHAFNADAVWKFNTGGGAFDALKYDIAYVYRLSPADYAPGEMTAWFAMIELNGQYETNSDHELFLSPGLVYVTAHWALETTIQLPVEQKLDNRAEREFVLGLGIRLNY